MENPDFFCTTKQFPAVTWGATGGLIGGIPKICGGYTQTNVKEERFSQACYALLPNGKSWSWKRDGATLSKGRKFISSGSLVVNNELVIAGGKDLDGLSTSIEVVRHDVRHCDATKLENIELPTKTYRSCIVPWDADTFMVIGGKPIDDWHSTNLQSTTYFINTNEGTVTKGPELLNARSNHACSELIVDGEEFIVVTGGQGLEKSVQKSTEYLSKASFKTDGWQEGTDLPVPIYDHQMVSSPDKQFVYTIGNEHQGSNKVIHKYTCPNNDIKKCQWNKIETKLKYGRERLVAFAIPNDLANMICQ